MDGSELKQKFENYLRQMGRKMTRERSIVFDFILQEEDSFTASDICASSSDGDISQATVYNTINYLLQCEILERVPTMNACTRFKLNKKILIEA